MADTPPENAVPGVNYDPYKDEGGEVNDFITKIFYPISGANGIFSTWRERHIGLAGASNGWRAPTMGNVPACPPLWSDEAQYYDGMGMLFNVIKCQWPTVSIAIAGALVKYGLTGTVI
jgi:hypothetical protein